MAATASSVSRPATIVRRKPSLDFSVTGLVYCSMMMFMGLAAINSQANLLFGVFGLMIGILLVTLVINWLVPMKLSVHRQLPEHGTVGQPVVISYRLLNRKRFWPSLSVTVAELDGADAFVRQPHAYLLHAASGNTAIVPAELIPKRRGVHQFDRFQVSTSFPFGFIKRAVERVEKDSLLIYPALGRVDPKLLAMFRSAESSGSSMRPRRGGMDEFYGVKEYRTGESPRHIYWRRSARTGTLVSKEMTHVSPPRLVLLVDTYHPPDAEPNRSAEVERCIAMAATIADRALETGLSVGMMAWSTEWTGIVPNRGKRHRRDLLTFLARLPANPSHDSRALQDASYTMLSGGTTPVLVTPDDVRLSLGESSRGSTVVISAANPQLTQLFIFDVHVDFSQSTPTEPIPA